MSNGQLGQREQMCGATAAAPAAPSTAAKLEEALGFAVRTKERVRGLIVEMTAGNEPNPEDPLPIEVRPLIVVLENIPGELTEQLAAINQSIDEIRGLLRL